MNDNGPTIMVWPKANQSSGTVTTINVALLIGSNNDNNIDIGIQNSNIEYPFILGIKLSNNLEIVTKDTANAVIVISLIVIFLNIIKPAYRQVKKPRLPTQELPWSGARVFLNLSVPLSNLLY